jgi:glycosyltransferase involved in cell wall biosynthesis
LKILTIINSLGNSSQYFIPFFEGLINKGHHFIVISPTSSEPTSIYNRFSRLGIDYVNLSKMDQGLSSLLGVVRSPLILTRIMRIISDENIDLIHVHGGSVPLILGCIVSNLKKIPLVLTIHGGRPSFSFRLNPLRQTHGIISTSLEQKEALSEEFKEIVVIPLPINLDKFFPISSVGMTKKLGRRISFFNTNASRPAVYSLLESAPRISELFGDAKIVISGWYPKYFELLNSIRKINEKIGSDIILLAGFEEDMPKALNQADVVIGIGMVAAEAMACGKPVIVASASFGGIVSEQNVAELRKYNFTGRNSNIPTDAENIFKSISLLLNNENYAKYLGEFGRRYAEKEFGLDKIAAQVELVYEHAKENAKNAANITSLFLASWRILCLMLFVFIKEMSIILKVSRLIGIIRKSFARITSRN